MIRRAPRGTPGFVMVRNATARDARLSFRARGILTYILSMPDDWTTTSEELADAGTEGRDAVRAALRELESAGYLTRSRYQNERGHWVTDAVIDECPTTGKPSSVSPATTRKPAGRTDDGKPGIGEPGLKTGKNFPLKNEKEEPSPVADGAPGDEDDGQLALVAETGDRLEVADAIDDLFDDWWDAYPRKIGKKQARTTWRRVVRELGGIRKAEPILVDGGNRWLQHWRKERTPQNLIPHPHTWLNRGDYESTPVPSTPQRRAR